MPAPIKILELDQDVDMVSNYRKQMITKLIQFSKKKKKDCTS